MGQEGDGQRRRAKGNEPSYNHVQAHIQHQAEEFSSAPPHPPISRLMTDTSLPKYRFKDKST